MITSYQFGGLTSAICKYCLLWVFSVTIIVTSEVVKKELSSSWNHFFSSASLCIIPLVLLWYNILSLILSQDQNRNHSK